MAIHVSSPPNKRLIAPIRIGASRVRPRAWLAALIGGLALAVGAALLGDERAVQPLLSAMGYAGTAAIVLGVRMHRPARGAPWHLIALCTLFTTTGMGILPTTGEFALAGVALTNAGYVAGFGGFVMLIRGRIPGGERAAFLDAAILASGTGALIWAFGFGPYVFAAQGDSVASAGFFFPALVASAVVARLWFLKGAHRPATRLLVLLVAATNGITTIDMLRGVAGSAVFTGPYLLVQFAALAFVAAAALHPSMALAPEAQQTDLRPISRHRIAALLTALLVNPATLAIEFAGGRQIDPAPYVIGGVLIGVLVIARLGDALRQLGDSLRERESLMDLLRHQALYDALTGLPNRSLFNERLSADFASRSDDRLLAVLLIDLDDFKAVNDSYGHDAGDALLVAFGERLRGAIRDGDMAARLGGDEFVIVLPACADLQVPGRVAERVLEAINSPFDVAGHLLTVHASVGVAVAGADALTPDDLVRNADLAMYRAKSRGKDRFELFEPEMQSAGMIQLELRTDLAEAIDLGDLRLHYQPVVDIRTGRTVGFEALVRWLRDGVLINPAAFVPIAEESGLIDRLTDWVLDEACRTTAAWCKPGERPWVSVNLSSCQLLRSDIVARVGRSLAETGLPADCLVVEITESALLDIDLARPAVERLSELGVRLAIDDFGTGYSALSYLARLPIDIVKIDRSFVAALEQAGPEEAIAIAIIDLARRLGLTTIGEGIETSAQLDQLAALGCDLGQGYYLGRPAANEDLRRPSPPPSNPRRQLTSVGSLTA
jgi:diguanylate cyclase (GGDEF)-like protein